MALRFFRRVRLAPGLTLNLSKRGGSLSMGPRGAKVTMGRTGIRRTVGLPGTGIWHTKKLGGSSGGTKTRRPSHRTHQTPMEETAHHPAITDRLTLGFFKKLFTPADEKNFVQGLRLVIEEKPEAAYRSLIKAPDIADARFVAGIMAMKLDKPKDAAKYLKAALRKKASLGKQFQKYGIQATFSFPITPRIEAWVTASAQGATLALAEVRQALGQWRASIKDLKDLLRQNGHDPVVLLALCEMLIEEDGSNQACKEVIRRTAKVENEDEVHAALLLWKGKALKELHLHTAARDTLTKAYRRKKDRSPELLHAIQYERALVHQRLGQNRRYREELERLFAEAPDFEDVMDRIASLD